MFRPHRPAPLPLILESSSPDNYSLPTSSHYASYYRPRRDSLATSLSTSSPTSPTSTTSSSVSSSKHHRSSLSSKTLEALQLRQIVHPSLLEEPAPVRRYPFRPRSSPPPSVILEADERRSTGDESAESSSVETTATSISLEEDLLEESRWSESDFGLDRKPSARHIARKFVHFESAGHSRDDPPPPPPSRNSFLKRTKSLIRLFTARDPSGVAKVTPSRSSQDSVEPTPSRMYPRPSISRPRSTSLPSPILRFPISPEREPSKASELPHGADLDPSPISPPSLEVKISPPSVIEEGEEAPRAVLNRRNTCLSTGTDTSLAAYRSVFDMFGRDETQLRSPIGVREESVTVPEPFGRPRGPREYPRADSPSSIYPPTLSTSHPDKHVLLVGNRLRFGPRLPDFETSTTTEDYRSHSPALTAFSDFGNFPLPPHSVPTIPPSSSFKEDLQSLRHLFPSLADCNTTFLRD